MIQDLNSIVDHWKRWARKKGRHPPWRVIKDPYLIAMAEILLQKTKAADVEPVWRKLTSEFPKPEDLVYAKDKDILAVIAGLGLGNQRTKRLKAMAAALSDNKLPENIPGLGPYGSGIVFFSIGQEVPTIPVDGNIARVVCRYFGLRFEHGEPRKKPEVREMVKSIIDTQRDLSQKLKVLYALVDLGDSICRLKPRCQHCISASSCVFAEHAHVKQC